MDVGVLRKTRELPPLPQRAQANMSSHDSNGESTQKQKRKRLKKAEGLDATDDTSVEMGDLNSRRESEVGDNIPTDTLSTAPPPQRRRRKKKAVAMDSEDDRADLVNGDSVDQAPDREETLRKPRKKKKFKAVESQLPEGLDVAEDDIITDTPPPLSQHSLFSAPQGQSQPVGKVFVERNKRFQASNRSNWRKTSVQMDALSDLQHVQPLWTTRDVSVRVHGGFRVLGLFCHGLLAGFALWNIVLVYMLAGQHLTTLANLLQQYQVLACPAQSLLYLLLAVSTVATFDRVNLAKGSDALREFVTLDPVALASFLYFSALVLSLSQQMTSDRINLYVASNATLWPPGSEQQLLHPWVTVNLVVALLVGVAWVCIATRPETDYTAGYLVAMETEAQKPDDKSEVTA